MILILGERMTKGKFQIEEDNIKKNLSACPLEKICNNSHKQVCQYNRELVKKFEIIV